MNKSRNELPFKVIEALFNQFKAINTNDIKDYLGVEIAQATRYLLTYKKNHAPAIYYDRKLKKHIALDDFKYFYIDQKDAAQVLRCTKFLFGKK